MKQNLKTCLDLLGLEEKGFQDHVADRGNWYKGQLIGTNHGVTPRALAAYRGSHITRADMKALTSDEARTIFTRAYWDTIHGDELPSGLDLAVFDFAVNAGPRQAVKCLQRELRVHADGILGGLTKVAIQRYAIRASLIRLINAYAKRRVSFLQRLRNWRTFKDGWTARVERITAAALDLVE